MSDKLIEVAAETTVHPTALDQGSADQRPTKRRRLILRRFLRNKTAVVGLVVILALALLALIGPWVSPWSYDQIDRRGFLKAPSDRHLLGTTQAGRDMLALTLQGLRKSLVIGFLVAILSTAVAAIVGSFAAYFGGWFERVALWVVDLLLVIPSFLLIAVVATGGPQGPVRVAAAGRAARRLQLAAVRAGRAQPDHVGEGTGVRPGRPLHGPVRAADHRSSHPAEHLLVVDHRRHAQRRCRDPRRDRPLVLRVRRAAARHFARHAARGRCPTGQQLPLAVHRTRGGRRRPRAQRERRG